MMKNRRHDTAGLGAPIFILAEIIAEMQSLQQKLSIKIKNKK